MIKSFIKTKLLHFLIFIAYRFNKTKIVGEENINNINSFILVTWHGKCLGVMEHFRQRNYHVLISQSRDGDIISNISKNMAIVFSEDLATEEEKKLWGKCMNFFH